jgi:3-oxoacyl-[acyl-carrier protein] reductase
MRTIVVSGGGTGIGRAVARAFVEAGDRVIVIGRRGDVLSRAAEDLNRNSKGGEPPVLPFAGDISQPSVATRLKGQIQQVGDGHVDVIVNNAGGVIRGPESSLEEIATNWLETYRSNILTAVMLTESLTSILRRPGGRIVNLSSIAAYRGGGGSYSAAKAAVTGWTFDLAARLGPEGITANVVVPGFVTDTEFFGDRMTAERRNRLVAQTLDGRAGEPKDVAAAVLYLASVEAAHVTGQVIHVNGGALFGR